MDPHWDALTTDSDGRTQWEAAQMAALEVLMDIANQHGVALAGGPAATIPRDLAPEEALGAAGMAAMRAMVAVLTIDGMT